MEHANVLPRWWRADAYRRRHISYSWSILTYLDILGFSDLVAETNAGHISRVLGLFKRKGRVHVAGKQKSGVEIHHFSDLTVRLLPVSAKDTNLAELPALFLRELRNLASIQAALVKEEVLLRGAMVLGDVAKSWGLIYGPALIEGYQRDQHGGPPRIIVSPDVLGLFAYGPPTLRTKARSAIFARCKDLLSRDADGEYFIDYLRVVERDFSDRRQYESWLNRHRRMVEYGLKTYSGSVRAKYQWLDAYHRRS